MKCATLPDVKDKHFCNVMFITESKCSVYNDMKC